MKTLPRILTGALTVSLLLSACGDSVKAPSLPGDTVPLPNITPIVEPWQPLFTVNTTDDLDDGTCNAAHCSLREAIHAANAVLYEHPVKIRFSIGGGGVQTIRPASPLPAVVGDVTIDGRTQPGYAGDPLIELDGSLAGAQASGLHLHGGGALKGLVINRFDGSGLRLTASGGNLSFTIQRNFIGTDVTGMLELGNGNGIHVHAPNALIGGSEMGNVISGNKNAGVVIGVDAPGTIVQGNYIGTNLGGTEGLGRQVGVFVAASGCTIGGAGMGYGNTISGNGKDGVWIYGGYEAHGNTVQLNLIGLDAGGTYAVPNGGSGIRIDRSYGNRIGAEAGPLGGGNIISGNRQHGVHLVGSSAQGNFVTGNLIGTNMAGTAAVPNDNNGVMVEAPNNTIGGGGTGLRNVISGNNGNGVVLFGLPGKNRVEGNYIGVDLSGSAALPNEGRGVEIVSSSFNVIGGEGGGAGNVISGNLRAGVYILAGDGSESNVIQGNWIGTDAAGSIALPNEMGLWVSGPANLIGGAAPAARNLISGNTGDGIQINRENNVVQGNSIGTDAAGTADLGNGATGVRVAASGHDTLIESNYIAFNDGHGVAIMTLAGGTGNAVRHNSIHDNGRLGIALDLDTVLPNDPQDLDHGSNNRQNYPILVSAVSSPNSTISGTLNSTPGSTFSLELFTNASCDPSGYGEGHRWIKSLDLTTDASGLATFEAVFPSTIFDMANFITATATDGAGNTSEFSNCIPVTAYVTPTPEPVGLFEKPHLSTDRLYYRGSGCGPKEVDFAIRAIDPSVRNVVLFFRLRDPATGEKTDWNDGVAMNPAGDGVYRFTLLAEKVPEFSRFREALLQYQFVAEGKGGAILGRTPVYGDLTFAACGR
jgi:CSLREA domain-containing protein